MPVVKTLTTKAIAEIAKAAAIAAVSIAVPGSQALTSLAGGISKEFFETLLVRTTEVERKLDRLLREPLKAALSLLNDAAKHSAKTASEITSRDSLLDDAHVFFSRAVALAADSREDCLFIKALDCIALAERTGRTSLAVSNLREVILELEDLHRRVLALQSEAEAWMYHVQALNRFLDRDSYRAKPFGYDAQIGLAKEQEKKARKAKEVSDTATFRFELLQNMTTIAKAAVEKAQDKLASLGIGDGSTAAS